MTRKNSCPRWESTLPTWQASVIPLGHKRWHQLKSLILLLISFPMTRCLSTWKCWPVFFLGSKFLTWTFHLPAKRQLSILLNFFFPLIKLFFNFVVFAKMWVTMWFRAKHAGYSTGLPHVCATTYWWPCGVNGWTYRRTYGRMNRRSCYYCTTTKISWLDRLPNLLSNRALLVRYICGLHY